MRRAELCCATVLAVGLLAVPSVGLAAAAPRVALVDLRTVGVERDSVAGLVPLIAAEAGKPPFRFVSQADIATVLGLERQKQLLGCSDSSCYAELAGALGVQYLLAAEVSAVGGVHLFSFAVLDASSGQSVSRSVKRVAAGRGIAGLLDVVPAVIAEAMAPLRARFAARTGGSAPAAATAGGMGSPMGGPGARRTAGYVADGVGAATLVAAVVLDVLAVRDHHSARDLLVAPGDPASEARFHKEYSGFKTKRAAALTLYGVGGAILVTGIVLTVLPQAR